MRLERTISNKNVGPIKSEKNLAELIDWQVSNITRILSLDLDAKAKQEMIKVIVDWPDLNKGPFTSLQ